MTHKENPEHYNVDETFQRPEDIGMSRKWKNPLFHKQSLEYMNFILNFLIMFIATKLLQNFVYVHKYFKLFSNFVI